MTQRFIPILATAALAGLPAVALAEEGDPSPYYFGINQGFHADTNVFRVRQGVPEPRDLYSATGVLAGIDQPFGRMKFGAKVAANANRFKNNKQLNYTDYDTLISLSGSTIERISGDALVYDRRSLNRYDLSSAEGAQREKDLLRVTGAAVRARIGLVTMWTLEGGYSYEQTEHSLAALSNRDVKQGAANVGIRFAPSDLWSVRVGVRRTDGEFPRFRQPNGQPLVDEFTRDDVDLSLTWVPTANSKMDARISSTKEDHSVQGQRNTRYVTGLVGYDWTLTGKTRMRFQFTRDTGAGRSDTDLNLQTESSDTQVRDAVSVKAVWDATSKVSVNATVNHSRRELDNAFTTGNVTETSAARDRLTRFGIGASWQAMRGLLFGCEVAQEKRSVQGENFTTTYPYDVATGNCNVQWTLR